MNEPSTPTHPTPDDWITPREAAAIIGVTDDHARYLARTGVIEARKFGHAWMLEHRLPVEGDRACPFVPRS